MEAYLQLLLGQKSEEVQQNEQFNFLLSTEQSQQFSFLRQCDAQRN
jgi:hypothetical protein